MPSAPALAPPLFARLKAETAAQHAALEARIDPLRRFQDRAAYTHYLARAHPLYRALEDVLARHDWPALGLDFPARRKLPLIEQDLAALSAMPDAATPDLPGFSDRATAIGALYVLEGATLGGQMISRKLKMLGLEPGHGASFFNGYGSRTGEYWLAFQDAAKRGVTTEAETLSAVVGAQAMFRCFDVWMAG